MENKRLKWSMSYMDCLWKNDMPEYLCQEGFLWTDVPYEKIEEYEEWMERGKVPAASGITLHGNGLNEDQLFHAIMKAEEWGASYVIIDTEELNSREAILGVFENCISLETVNIPSGLHLDKKTFLNCVNLKEICDFSKRRISVQ